MSLKFKCSEEVIEKVMKKLKSDGLVSENAYFNDDAENDLRHEVAYRDLDFLRYLTNTSGDEVVYSILDFLKEMKVTEESAFYDNDSFSKLKEIVKSKFKVPSTSITLLMERLLFMLSSVKKHKKIIAIGISCGYTLIWNTGTSLLTNGNNSVEKIIGIDIDPESIKIAKSNIENLHRTEIIDLLSEDALITLEKLDDTFDYVYLDADNKEIGKGLYLKLLKTIYPKLAKGAWVLAHDVTFYYFKDQLKEYLNFVRNKNYFSESICFDIDPYGLELSIK